MAEGSHNPDIARQEVAKHDIALLIEEHHAALYRYAYRLSGSVADAEDLVQQVFLVAHTKLDQLREAEAARSWLFTTLRRRFLRMVKQSQPTAASSLEMNLEEVVEDDNSAYSSVDESDSLDTEGLQNALNELPADFRLVVVMFYFEHRSYREIAESLDVPIGTVMSRLARAKRQLRSRLAPVATGAKRTPGKDAEP